jgi:hypothetical protein
MIPLLLAIKREMYNEDEINMSLDNALNDQDNQSRIVLIRKVYDILKAKDILPTGKLSLN